MKLQDERNIRTLVFLVSLIAFICLVGAGFLAPPTGKIDKSVLYAAGMLMAWPMTYTLPDALKTMKEWKVQVGNVNLHAKTETTGGVES